MRLRWAGDDQWAVTTPTGALAWSQHEPPPPGQWAATEHGHGKHTGDLYVGPADRVLASLPDLDGTVKLAYLDPPYNTGRTFTDYGDREETALWLTMMRQTLAQVHRSLRTDGSAWIHLDDGEVHRVRLLAEEVFGPANFVADVVWERKRKPSYLHGQLAQVTDHILVFAKDRTQLGRFGTGEQVASRRVPLHHGSNTPTVLRFPAGSVQMPQQLGAIAAGDMSTASVRTELLDDIEVVQGRNAADFAMFGSFRWTQERLDRELAAGATLLVSSRLPLRPNVISGSGSKTWTTLFTRATGVTTNEAAREHQHALFGHAGFDTPKPEELLARIIETATAPGDLVLDPFAGSGTTGAAAHKLGRRWLTVELSQQTVDTYVLPRLAQVVAGTDEGGATYKHVPALTVPTPEGLTARQARLAAQWLGDLAAAGELDGLDPETVAKAAARMREAASAATAVRVHEGGGAFRVWSPAAAVAAA